MGVAKVTVNNVVKVDLTSDTVAADKLLSDYTAHGADGEAITGTYAGSSGGAVESDVNFYDYDGTLVKSYTAADFASLTAFPDNPSHTGLTAQGWNWSSLSDAKNYVATYGKLDVGQLYITDDAKTRFYITLSETSQLNLGMNIAINGTAYVDWGDGSSIGSMSDSSLTRQHPISHTYSNLGDYVISIWPDTTANNQIGLYGTGSSLLFYYNNNEPSGTGTNKYYGILSILNKVECGRIQSFRQYAFSGCKRLKSISMSSAVSVIGDHAFNDAGLEYIVIPPSVLFGNADTRIFTNCYNLQGISIPYPEDGSYMNCGIGSYFFQYCYSLKHITLPHNCTAISSYAFADCRSLTYAVIPDSVASISSYIFQYDYNLKYVITHNLSSISTIPTGFCSTCVSLRSFTISNSVRTIQPYAFTQNGFTRLVIPEGVTSIQGSSFDYSQSLLYLSISSTVASISTTAFAYGYSMQEIHFKGTTPPALSNSNVFISLNTKCKIYVPTGYLSAYTGATNYPSSSTYTYIEE